MITARNYAAQLVRQLTMSPDEKVRQTANFYGRAIHFALPDGGRIFDTNFHSVENTNINLPYKLISVEYYMGNAEAVKKGQERSSKRCILAEQTEKDGDISILISLYQDSSSTWGLLPFLFTVPPKMLDSAKTKITPFVRVKEVSEWWNILSIDRQREFIMEQFSEIGAVFALVEALSCVNITTELLEKVDQKVNAKRVQNGKLPLYETKILVVRTPQDSRRYQTAGGGSNASPRQHLRRGHIRRLPKANIWVNSCIVGDPSKGRIDKKYFVTK